MAVPALSSLGYDGITVNEVAWARLARYMGAEYAVGGASDLKVTAVAGADRAVQIASGEAFGQGVLDEFDTATIQLPSVASGTRWDLITVRRDWQPPGGTSHIDYLTGTTGKTLPAGRISGAPGVEDDQPIALVQCSSTSTMPTAIVDLRVLKGAGGLRGFDELAKTYLDQIGEVLRIGSDIWVCDVDSVGNPAWSREVSYVARERTWTIDRDEPRSVDEWTGTGTLLAGTIAGAPPGKYLVVPSLAVQLKPGGPAATAATARIVVGGRTTSARVDLTGVSDTDTPPAVHRHGGGDLAVVVYVDVASGVWAQVINPFTRVDVVYLGP